MKSFGLVLIVLGLLSIVLGLLGVAGGGFNVKSLAFMGVVMAVGGFLLYRRHRGKEVPGRS